MVRAASIFTCVVGAAAAFCVKTKVRVADDCVVTAVVAPLNETALFPEVALDKVPVRSRKV